MDLLRFHSLFLSKTQIEYTLYRYQLIKTAYTQLSAAIVLLSFIVPYASLALSLYIAQKSFIFITKFNKWTIKISNGNPKNYTNFGIVCKSSIFFFSKPSRRQINLLARSRLSFAIPMRTKCLRFKV